METRPLFRRTKLLGIPLSLLSSLSSFTVCLGGTYCVPGPVLNTRDAMPRRSSWSVGRSNTMTPWNDAMKQVNSAVEPIAQESDPLWKTDPRDTKMRQRKQLVWRSYWSKAKVAIPENEGRLGGMMWHWRGRSMPVGPPFYVLDFIT